MQPSLLAITKDDGSNVQLPITTSEVQAVRNDAAFGSGKYYAYFSDGTKELIGGPALGIGSQLAVEITYVELTRVATAVVVGAVGAVTYSWSVKSATNITGTTEPTFTGATNAATATVTDAGGSNVTGMIAVKVTDSIGRVAYGYYTVGIQAAS